MWPKLLDLSKDECRGLLRRLELESYATVIGAFRAQGKLNETKTRILKDLREAFHISDDRHRAEIRRVVNDEYLSTVAKMIYGPNSEIEWNKEGSRRYLLIDRKLPQTALSIVANDASYVGKKLNERLLSPAHTARTQKTSHNTQNTQNTNGAAKLVTEDPNDFRTNRSVTKSNNNCTTTTTSTNSKTEVNRVANNLLDEKKRTNIRINNIDEIYPKGEVQSGHIETKSNPIKLEHENSIPKPKMMNRRRKTITAFDFETSPTTKISTPLDKSRAKLSSTGDDHHSFQSHFNDRTPNIANDSNSNVNTVKLNAREVHNVAKVSSRVFEIIEGNTAKTALSVNKPPSPILKRPKITPTRTIVHHHIAKTEPIKSCPTNILKQKLPIKSFDTECIQRDDLLNQIRNQKVQTVGPEASTSEENINFMKRIESPIYRKDFIPIPSARNPNIVKTNDRTIMHITPIQPHDQLHLLNRNQKQIPKKHIVQVISPQTHPRTITIHPNNAMFEVGREVQDKCNARVGNWQNYDPSNIRIVNANKTIAGTRNDHSYPNVVMEDIVYADNIEEDIIAEEYIAAEEFSPDNVIEMVYDGAEV